MNMGERLKELRLLKGATQEDVGKVISVSKATIMKYEKGLVENLKRSSIEKLAKYFNVAPSYLMCMDDDKSICNSSAVVFVYGTIPAGIPMECIEDIIDTEEISADMLKGSKQYFGLRVKGNSMEPEYLDGDTLILEKVDDCESGDDAVVMVNGDDGTFKRVFKNENGIILQPLNPTYSPMVYTNEQIEKLPVKVLGIVVEIRRKKRRK